MGVFPGYYFEQNVLPKAKKEYPKLSEVPSQVLQTTIRRLHDAWDFFLKRGYGFPRCKKYGQLKSILYPQVKANCLTGWQIALPKLGSIPINLDRPIPEGFAIKQVRIVKHSGDLGSCNHDRVRRIDSGTTTSRSCYWS